MHRRPVESKFPKRPVSTIVPGIDGSSCLRFLWSTRIRKDKELHANAEKNEFFGG